MLQEGDVVQITNEDSEWVGALFVIESVHDWGIKAYIPLNQGNVIPCRFSHDEFTTIGGEVVHGSR